MTMKQGCIYVTCMQFMYVEYKHAFALLKESNVTFHQWWPGTHTRRQMFCIY